MSVNKKRSDRIFSLVIFFFLLANIPIILSQEENSDPDIIPYLFEPVGSKEDLELDSNHGVDLFSGAMTYSYPVKVPPGTNGLEPTISINYNSHATNDVPGLVGSSWELNENYIQRNTNGTFKNPVDDFFELFIDGSSSEIVYVSSENKYHTKIDSFIHIKNQSGGNNSKGEYWIVRTKEIRT